MTEMFAPRARRQTARGERSRQAILETAARLATVEGLEGLSIGRLAEALGVSKSGLYAHFGSKEELQLATIETAVAIYNREIVEPALAVPIGVQRILRLCDAFFDFVGSGDFPGGCFFVYTSVDPANRRESIRTRLADDRREAPRLRAGRHNDRRRCQLRAARRTRIPG